MKWLTLLLLTGLLVKQTFADKPKPESKITGHVSLNGAKLHCAVGSWNGTDTAILDLLYEDINTEYTCNGTKVYVKFRTCDTCIEMDYISIIAIIIGNVSATAVIGVAVYNLSAQPRPKGFTGNKSSDKRTLLNGDGDTYQQLTPGQSSAYSELGVRRK